MAGRARSEDLAPAAAQVIHGGFAEYADAFDRITLRSRSRFELRDWAGRQADALERLTLYPRTIERVVAALQELLEERSGDRRLWAKIKTRFSGIEDREPNFELARTFYNSITRRIFSTAGVNPDIEYASLNPSITDHKLDPGIYKRFLGGDDARELFVRILEDYGFGVNYRDAAGDANLLGRRAIVRLDALWGAQRIDAIDLMRQVFYRGQSAYLVGRVITGNHTLPLVLALVNGPEGIHVDALLLRESEVSILFSFTRAYFHVDAPRPREVIAFLKTIMPLKPVEDLYRAIGCNKHAKTESFRSLQRHLGDSSDPFEYASGERGMVMIVFTLPSYDQVFKVIRDDFAFPKKTTPRQVMERYRMVFHRDRVGRMVEAQLFRQLEIRVDRFSKELLEELLDRASRTIVRKGDFLVFDHVYTERKVRPLNLYLREAAPGAARRAVVDYGEAIKELAAANIFPGDFLLKNFGVTRHSRVVFYDYDELCKLTDCNFRRLPTSRNPEDELSDEPWFSVAENDVFPEEFGRFLGLPPELREVFDERHSELLTAAFWQDMQRLNRDGALLDFFPYPRSERLYAEGDG